MLATKFLARLQSRADIERPVFAAGDRVALSRLTDGMVLPVDPFEPRATIRWTAAFPYRTSERRSALRGGP